MDQGSGAWSRGPYGYSNYIEPQITYGYGYGYTGEIKLAAPVLEL
jgi:hypothetical protein